MIHYLIFIDAGDKEVLRREYTNAETAQRVRTFLEKFHPNGMVLCYDEVAAEEAKKYWHENP